MRARRGLDASGADIRRPQYNRRNADGDLPPWAPPTPADGWTLDKAEAAARAYAADVIGANPELDPRRVTFAAFKSLLTTPALSRAYTLERLQRIERFPRRAKSRANAPRPTDDDSLDDAPF